MPRQYAFIIILVLGIFWMDAHMTSWVSICMMGALVLGLIVLWAAVALHTIKGLVIVYERRQRARLIPEIDRRMQWLKMEHNRYEEDCSRKRCMMARYHELEHLRKYILMEQSVGEVDESLLTRAWRKP